MNLKWIWMPLIAVGVALFLLGVLAFPLMEIIMWLIIEDSGWPYWPSRVIPGPRNFESVAGDIGLAIREIYIQRFILILLGSALIVVSLLLRRHGSIVDTAMLDE
ncbi:hypothetical protein EU537_00120 [Candidatus Thorarchaeota archaeon]|nr:MAG: hypothetical protein EU537_00120 [Candidatus Thorarchaeota archaeon]